MKNVAMKEHIFNTEQSMSLMIRKCEEDLDNVQNFIRGFNLQFLEHQKSLTKQLDKLANKSDNSPLSMSEA